MGIIIKVIFTNLVIQKLFYHFESISIFSNVFLLYIKESSEKSKTKKHWENIGRLRNI